LKTEDYDALLQSKQLVDKQLEEKIMECNTLTIEVRTLEETNAEIAAETQKAITRMTEEMEQMRHQFQAQLAKLEADLRRTQIDRDELQSAYQFAKDELEVIRTTLNSMEEGTKSVRYITDSPGNPTLVNRMNNEWGRVAGLSPPETRQSPVSAQRSAFSRDFKQAHGALNRPKPSPISDRVKQGDIGDHWRP